MAQLLADAETPRLPADGPQFQLSGWIDTAPFEDLLDISILDARQGRAVLSMPFKVKHCQGAGLMHGGALTSLADTAVAMAIKSLLPAGSLFATTELRMAFLAPVKSGTVIAEAQVRGPEGRDFFGEVVLQDEGGKEVAKLHCTFRLLRSQQVPS